VKTENRHARQGGEAVGEAIDADLMNAGKIPGHEDARRRRTSTFPFLRYDARRPSWTSESRCVFQVK